MVFAEREYAGVFRLSLDREPSIGNDHLSGYE